VGGLHAALPSIGELVYPEFIACAVGIAPDAAEINHPRIAALVGIRTFVTYTCAWACLAIRANRFDIIQLGGQWVDATQCGVHRDIRLMPSGKTELSGGLSMTKG
jgi:hypothetical protein